MFVIIISNCILELKGRYSSTLCCKINKSMLFLVMLVDEKFFGHPADIEGWIQPCSHPFAKQAPCWNLVAWIIDLDLGGQTCKRNRGIENGFNGMFFRCLSQSVPDFGNL